MSMASFLRGKQAGIERDLSANILSASFSPAEQSRYGIASSISCLAFEPVQSLLAIGTSESSTTTGQIHVFGQARVHKFLLPPRPTSFCSLHFVANRLISLNTRSELDIWDLNAGAHVKHYAVPAAVVCALTDPMLDWAFLGLVNGDVLAYDLDRERPSLFRIPNLWTQKRDPDAKGMRMVGMQLHPRDVGQLLIAYSHGVVIYSFKQNEALTFFEYILPPGAPGGGGGDGVETVRKPRVTHACWHPAGTFVLTAHDDGSLVFWDAKDRRLLMARSLYHSRVNEPGPNTPNPVVMEPFVKIAWCCKQNPDDTALLIAGGQAVDAPEKGFTFIELGSAPMYATSSWDVLANHFEGKKTTTIETPIGSTIVDCCLLPRESPHFAGAQDPIAIIALLSSGELVTLSFPLNHSISPTNQLHPSLSLVHPFATKLAVATLDRERWLGMREERNQGDLLVKGGAGIPKRKRRYEGRNIVQVAHADGIVRLWDVGHGDEIENPSQIQVDVARAVNCSEPCEVTAMDMAEMTGEFAVGTKQGDLVIYKWGGNRSFGRLPGNQVDIRPGGLTDISSRMEPSLREGLQPFVLYATEQGPVTTTCVSDVGFVAVGNAGGLLSIIDLRGPKIIFRSSVMEIAKLEKKSSLLHRHTKSKSNAAPEQEWPVATEFGVMIVGDDSYSSIACFIGTNLGRVITFKLLPQGQDYQVQIAGVVALGDQVISLNPILTDTGLPAVASGPVVARLRQGAAICGTLVVATQSSVHILRSATSKGAAKSLDGAACVAAAVTEFELHGVALVVAFGNNTVRAFSLPGFKDLGRADLPSLDPDRISQTIIAKTGDIIAWTAPTEFTVLPVWGTSCGLANTDDVMINPELTTPLRPTITNLQWLSGTQFISPTDLDLLIGGLDRPPSKRMLEAAVAERGAARSGVGGSAGRTGTSTDQDGWGEYLTRQLNERTEKLNTMSDNMESLQESSAGWADDVGRLINKQTRGMVLGAIKGKFL